MWEGIEKSDQQSQVAEWVEIIQTGKAKTDIGEYCKVAKLYL